MQAAQASYSGKAQHYRQRDAFTNLDDAGKEKVHCEVHLTHHNVLPGGDEQIFIGSFNAAPFVKGSFDKELKEDECMKPFQAHSWHIEARRPCSNLLGNS